MEIVIINLARSKDRWTSISSQLEALSASHASVHREAGIDGQTGDVEIFLSKVSQIRAKLKKGRVLTKTQIGCFASHYNVWQRCVKNGKPLIVLEDDAKINIGGLQKFIEGVEGLPSCYKCIRLSSNETKNAKQKKVGQFEDILIVRYTKAHMTAVGYYLTPKGAQDFIRKSERWSLPVDLFMGEFWRHNVDCYGVIPAILEPKKDMVSTRSPQNRNPRNIFFKFTKSMYSFYRSIRRIYSNINYV